MRDYVNVNKPTAIQFWMRKNCHNLRFIAGLVALAIIGSLGV